MPYIKQDDRKTVLWDYRGRMPANAGELNYCISKLVHNYILRLGPLNYAQVNEVVGALECAKLELYRQVAAPYEDKKKSENGPVSELDE